jgi:hypothetical protein
MGVVAAVEKVVRPEDNPILLSKRCTTGAVNFDQPFRQVEGLEESLVETLSSTPRAGKLFGNLFATSGRCSHAAFERGREERGTKNLKHSKPAASQGKRLE